MSNIGDYAIVEGSKSERRSSNTTNYYTMLIDDSIKINKDEREVWIGGKCIAIKLSLYDNIIKKT